MCLLLVAHDCSPEYRLVIAANRDEFHQRPSAPAAFWNEGSGILAGRDLEAGGTWLGLHESGRFATVTNVRAGGQARRGPRSRGLIVTDFLAGTADARSFTRSLDRAAGEYDGFNLLAHDGRQLAWYSNQAPGSRVLAAGIYTLSNASLDTPWPKTLRLRAGFERIMAQSPGDPLPALLALLRDARPALDEELPDTGVGRERERLLSAIFIEGAGYGTRCSSVVTLDRRGRLRFHERRYDANAEISGDSAFELDLAPARA